MPDPLTTDDIEAILRGGGSAAEKLQRAARLGAERERERAARVCEDRSRDCGTGAWCKQLDDCAAAIRRGEGEQA